MTQRHDELPPPPGQRLPHRRARRRRDPISRDAIVAAAIGLLDAEGLDALSMRRIADELGTGPASLYWHVGSKDGLLDLVFDAIIGEGLAGYSGRLMEELGEIPDPVPGKWREQIKEVARQQRNLCLRHPWIVRVSIGRIPMGPNALRYSERVLAILRAGGLPPALAVRASHLLIATVNGFTLDETGVGDSAAEDIEADMREAAGEARDYLASLPTESFPNLVELADEFGYIDRDVSFELLLDIFLDGLARAAAISGGSGGRPPGRNSKETTGAADL